MRLAHISSEPYRLFFPLGIILLCWGALVWVPLLWTAEDYPVLLHRYLMLNGFTASFIGGFLMTALPRFSQTKHASPLELGLFLAVTIAGLIAAKIEHERCVFIFSTLQPILILVFMLSRISKRKENPPYSFVFIFIGLFLWILSGLGSAFYDQEIFKELHYEGAIAAIILGVGSRLIPGILGHVEIVSSQRKEYENLKPILKTVPLHFFTLVLAFGISYFMPEQFGAIIRAAVASLIAIFYWRIFTAPKIKTSLTWSIWLSCWFMMMSFVLKCIWNEGFIHASHAFFISGIVLLSLLIATRVIQSHGPKDKTLENSKVLYAITVLLVLAAATRVSAYLMPETYLSHLAYSSIILVLSVLIWALKYLRFVLTKT